MPPFRRFFLGAAAPALGLLTLASIDTSAPAERVTMPRLAPVLRPAHLTIASPPTSVVPRSASVPTRQPASGERTPVRPSPPAPVPRRSTAVSAPHSAPGGAWECIRQRESGGNYAESSNPRYRGAYQIGYSEWASAGGTGDPAAASPAEQDMRAQRLQSARGWQPWSTAGACGLR
jgi:hypothetical protein